MDTPRAPSSSEQRDSATGPHRTPTIKATLQRQGCIAALPNTWKQTQGGSQNGETNKSQVEEQGKAPEKELSKMEKSNFPDAKFKTLLLRMLNDLSGKLNKDIINIKIEIEAKNDKK